MLNTEHSYRHDIDQIKNTLDAKALWHEAFKNYPQLSDALAKPGAHCDCMLHDGVDGNGFRFFDDAFKPGRKTKAIAICNTCGAFTPLNLMLALEGKENLDAEMIERLAVIAGMDAIEPVKPLTKEKAGGGSRYPAFALSQSRPVDGVAITYLQNRGLPVDALPDVIRCLSDAEYKTKGETVFKGECLVSPLTFAGGDLAGIIRIFLSADGGKADIRDGNGKSVDPKPMTKSQESLVGGAVRMPGQGSIEHVGEGIETMLAVKSVLPEPVAACGTAALLSGFEPSPDTQAVIVWSDKDKSGTGQKHASKLVDKLKEQGMPAVMVVPPYVIEDGAKGVDWLDVFNRKDGAEVIRKTYAEAIGKTKALAENMVKGREIEKNTVNLSEINYQQTVEQPYQALGYDRENVYLMTKVNRQVRAIAYKSLGSKALMLSIASYDYWIGIYPKYDKRNGELTGPDYELCINQIIQQSNEAGVYDPAVIRGRGFNLDNGRLVRHLGDRLIVDGQTIDLYAFDSEYTYEQTTRLTVGTYEPLTKEEALRVEEACSLPFWKGKADPFLFLGWCVLSPFCGALRWRPHLWITAPAGTGKSTWLVPLVDAIAGKANLAKFDNVSTEAGIRQTLRHDARPVLLEEAEAETPKEKRRLEGIIQYARNCSTSNDIQTAKGTPGGTALTFSGSSMFSYISTKDVLSFSSDKSRTACIELYKVESAERIDEHAQRLTALKLEFDKQNLSERLITLLSANWQMLQTNIKVFSMEAGKQLRSPRHGDQYGTLLAGYWTATKQREVTEEEARTLICSIDLNSMTEDQDEQTDEQRCLDLIMAVDVTVEVFRTNRLTIREAITALSGEDDDHLALIGSGGGDTIDPKAEAEKALRRVLRRHGIIYQAHNEQLHGCKGRGIYIANNCEYLKKHMDKTPFVNWPKILMRLDKAKSLPKEKYLKINGKSAKAVFIDLEV